MPHHRSPTIKQAREADASWAEQLKAEVQAWITDRQKLIRLLMVEGQRVWLRHGQLRGVRLLEDGDAKSERWFLVTREAIALQILTYECNVLDTWLIARTPEHDAELERLLGRLAWLQAAAMGAGSTWGKMVRLGERG